MSSRRCERFILNMRQDVGDESCRDGGEHPFVSPILILILILIPVMMFWGTLITGGIVREPAASLRESSALTKAPLPNLLQVKQEREREREREIVGEGVR